MRRLPLALALAAVVLCAFTADASAVTRIPGRCAIKPTSRLCAIHFHRGRANHYRSKLGLAPIPYHWVAESHPARRDRILTYWTHVHAQARHRWLTRPRLLVPEPYHSNLMCIHGGEGSWTAYNPAGYYGGMQMDWAFMRHWGADMLARHGGRDARYWTPAEQLYVAYLAARSIGYGPWPNTGAACGL